jgi:ribosome-associated protein
MTKKNNPEHQKTISKTSTLKKALSILNQKHAKEVFIYDLRPLSQLFDYAVIASGLSTTQLDVIRKSLERGLTIDGTRPYGVEGTAESGWILLDYIDFIIHVFTPEKRDYYRLDQLWGDVPSEEVDEDFPSS